MEFLVGHFNTLSFVISLLNSSMSTHWTHSYVQDLRMCRLLYTFLYDIHLLPIE